MLCIQFYSFLNSLYRIITSDLQMRNRFFTGFKNVSEIQRYSINILVAAENSVGYMRMGEGTNTPVICEGVGFNLVSFIFRALPELFLSHLIKQPLISFTLDWKMDKFWFLIQKMFIREMKNQTANVLSNDND